MIGIPQIGDLFKQMIPPDFEYLQQITTPMLDTIRMAIVSTVLGSIVSIPIALLCASNIVHQKWISIPSRFILNIVRTIPDLLLAAILWLYLESVKFQDISIVYFNYLYY